LCKRPGRIASAPGAAGIERLEAHLFGAPFAPHRHDTYAVGITLAGVQTFRFRGARWQCLPGQCHLLHPDEVHDGAAATEQGFAYRMVYVDPALVRDALGGGPLPFAANPVLEARRLPDVSPAIWRFDGPLDEAARVDLVVAVADLLAAAASVPKRPIGPLGIEGVRRARDLIAASPGQVPMHALERASGLDRWTLARQFRAAYGTSPSRYRTMRRLDAVRRLLRAGVPPAQAALEAGFADQAHMARRFKAAYGLTPGDWAAATGASRSSKPRCR
jgi:AraC-like DNA-binding protein